MQMQPIVNGLQDIYTNDIAFLQYDANKDDGKALFEQLKLPGHPSILIYTPDGEEVYRHFGTVTFDDLENTLLDVIEM